MSKISLGTRVKFSTKFTKPSRGEENKYTGTVVEISGDRVRVKWDDPNEVSTPTGVHIRSLSPE